MRKQPITVFAILILASFGLALSGCQKKEPSPTEQMQQGAQQMGQGVKKAASDAGDKVKQGAQQVGDSVTDAAGKARQALSDSAITGKIKSELATNQGLSSFDIHVDTAEGVVTLTGTVDDASKSELAEKVAKDTEGVKSVDNKIELNESE